MLFSLQRKKKKKINLSLGEMKNQNKDKRQGVRNIPSGSLSASSNARGPPHRLLAGQETAISERKKEERRAIDSMAQVTQKNK
jgi:hypothetical protein